FGYERQDRKDKNLSKWLSWILRHGAVKEGLHIGADGFVDVSEIEQNRGFHGKFTLADIERVVAENDKQRFTLKTHPESGKLQIKANQGHSIGVITQSLCIHIPLQVVQDPDLSAVVDASEVPTVIHGTYFRNWARIKTEGLSRMNRLHIHFCPGEPGESQVISGMRSSCQLYIYINMEKALAGKAVAAYTRETIFLC
ncbi:hypothetical protein ANN_12087, partial [Periplaneta americana]